MHDKLTSFKGCKSPFDSTLRVSILANFLAGGFSRTMESADDDDDDVWGCTTNASEVLAAAASTTHRAVEEKDCIVIIQFDADIGRLPLFCSLRSVGDTTAGSSEEAEKMDWSSPPRLFVCWFIGLRLLGSVDDLSTLDAVVCGGARRPLSNQHCCRLLKIIEHGGRCDDERCDGHHDGRIQSESR